jgi:hypothetical protein
VAAVELVAWPLPVDGAPREELGDEVPELVPSAACEAGPAADLAGPPVPGPPVPGPRGGGGGPLPPPASNRLAGACEGP